MTDSAATTPLSTLVLGLACGTATALFWAIGLVAAKHGISAGLGPADIAFHRHVWIGLVMLPLLLRNNGLRDLGGVGWGRGAALTIFGGPPLSILSYAGFLLVPLGHGGVIQPSCAALGGTVLAALVLREPLPMLRLVGAVAMVAGLVLLGWEAVTTIGSHGVLGDFAFIGAGSSFAVFGLLLRLWRITPVRAVVIMSVLSLAYAPVHWALFGFAHMAEVGWTENLLQIVVQGVFSGALSIYLFTRAVVLLGAGRAAVFPALVPALTLLIGFVALGEVPSHIQLAGLLVVAIGFRLALK